MPSLDEGNSPAITTINNDNMIFYKQTPSIVIDIFNIVVLVFNIPIWRPAEAGGERPLGGAARIGKITQSIYYD